MAVMTQVHRPRIIYRDAKGERAEATYNMVGKMRIVEERGAPIDLADGIGWKTNQVMSMFERGLWDVALGGPSVIITGLTQLGRQVLADYNKKYPKE
jgi:hypothetical protein